MFRNWLNIISVSCLFLLTNLAWSEEFKVGLIDENRLLSEYSASRNAEQEIINLRKELTGFLEELNEQLEKDEKNKALSKQQKEQKRKEAESRLLAKKQKAEEIASLMREKIEEDLQKAIKAEGQAQSLNLILSKDTTFLGGTDITNDVLKRLDE